MSVAVRPQATTSLTTSALPQLDYWLIGSALALLGFGFIMVASASMHLGDRLVGNPFYHLSRHGIAVGLGLTGALIVSQIPTEQWQRSGPILYFIGLGMLVLVLVPGVGREANGATRWIPIGPFSLQSSEFMKLFLVVYIAGYLVRRQLEVAHTVKGFIKPMILLVFAASLIMMQPDFGTTTVLLGTALGMLFLGGVPLWQFALLLGVTGATMSALVFRSPERLERVTSFLNPWAKEYVNDGGYQLAQALIAFGRGEWFGVGLGNGIQKLFYLPEAHTDFLMAVIGEEFGLLGTLVVIGLFSVVVWRAFRIGARAEALGQRFSAYVAYGLGLWLGMQAFINVGVNIGLLPTKGLTLPLMSYGGNSIIVACLVIALLLRIDFETRRDAPRHKLEQVKWVHA